MKNLQRIMDVIFFNLFTIIIILPLMAYHVALLTWKFMTSKEEK